MINRTIMANLLDVFHLSIDEIGDLTDFQIFKIYYHARTKEGTIKEVPLPKEDFGKKEELKIEEVVDEKSERFKEYMASEIALANLKVRGWMEDSEYTRALILLREKFADVLPAERKIEVDKSVSSYEESYNSLMSFRNKGLMTQREFEEATERLQQISQ